MKDVIKHFFPLTLTILCAIFAIHIFLYSFTDIGNIFSDVTQQHLSSSVIEQINAKPESPIPTPKYIGKTLHVGTPTAFDDLFVLELADHTITTVEDLPNTALYLVDVTSSNGVSLLTELSSSDIDNMEEIPSAVIYDKENRLLYFYRSGVYTLHIRLYFNHQSGVLFECQIPVEAR